MTWDIALCSALGGFFGSALGFVYTVKLAIKQIYKHINEDPELEKIEINVTMKESDNQ